MQRKEMSNLLSSFLKDKKMEEKAVEIWEIGSIFYIFAEVQNTNKFWTRHKTSIRCTTKSQNNIPKLINEALNESYVSEGPINELDDKLFYKLVKVKDEKHIAKIGGVFLSLDINCMGIYYNPHIFKDGSYCSLGRKELVHLDSLEPEELERKLWIAFEKCKVGK